MKRRTFLAAMLAIPATPVIAKLPEKIVEPELLGVDLAKEQTEGTGVAIVSQGELATQEGLMNPDVWAQKMIDAFHEAALKGVA